MTVERRRFGWIEAACLGVVGVVEPESNVEGVGRGQRHRRIKAEDLIDEDRSNHREGIAEAVGLNVRLIPGQSEVLESWIHGPVRQQLVF